jgi:hypothetical protein
MGALPGCCGDGGELLGSVQHISLSIKYLSVAKGFI